MCCVQVMVMIFHGSQQFYSLESQWANINQWLKKLPLKKITRNGNFSLLARSQLNKKHFSCQKMFIFNGLLPLVLVDTVDGINLHPEWSDHKWTVRSAGVNAPKTHWGIMLDWIAQTTIWGGLDPMGQSGVQWKPAHSTHELHALVHCNANYVLKLSYVKG